MQALLLDLKHAARLLRRSPSFTLAALLPAWRASRVDPLEALRAE